MLDQILAHTRRRVTAAEAAKPLHQLMKALEDQTPAFSPRSLSRAFDQQAAMAVIAEIKRASPSKGPLNMTLDPEKQADWYEQAGAAVISVLTEPEYFKGSDEDLVQVRRRVKCPVLRKDFLITPYQLYESRLLQADVVLLIAAALPGDQLAAMHRQAEALGLQCLMEVHNREEVERVLALPLQRERDFIGINNRNLKTFQISLETTRQLRPLIPGEFICISESGISTPDTVAELNEMNIQGILVGEALVTAADPGNALKLLVETG
ncbi:indole-3-glycerol phosphate synthase TrpC [Anoxynatronum buryatiense]|uniref:indole-3-glycerol-phosphate synthase n=1 Tax=Anoxynatronum buryatiense TaxID=489973 RepID=A0AA45WXB1_9CLOT|nr:indole-3-glycerol phosphate synthase TrpC [Anoxynatronum buryatiense]SMP61669.1 indole-3-glycerol phosphate synthase [Anoxynatronum buryatiense]